MSIDTLKLAKRLEAANMPKAQAEALAEGIGETLQEATVTKQDLAVAVAELKQDLGVAVADLRTEIRTSAAKVKTEILYWVLGSVGLGVVINHFWH